MEVTEQNETKIKQTNNAPRWAAAKLLAILFTEYQLHPNTAEIYFGPGGQQTPSV